MSSAHKPMFSSVSCVRSWEIILPQGGERMRLHFPMRSPNVGRRTIPYQRLWPLLPITLMALLGPITCQSRVAWLSRRSIYMVRPRGKICARTSCPTCFFIWANNEQPPMRIQQSTMEAQQAPLENQQSRFANQQWRFSKQPWRINNQDSPNNNGY